jgi:hypothetical protein
MPRYLLVEVDDNASADRMRAKIDAATEAGKGMRVVGVFAKPSSLCGCEVRSEKSVRGAKFGWWLCPECRRPKTGAPQTLRSMLDDPETPAKYRELMLSMRWISDTVTGKILTALSLPRHEWR